MNEDMGKKLLIGGGAVALGIIILNQIYTSGFQAGLMAAGAAPGTWDRYDRFDGPGFPFGLFFLIGLGVFIWFKVTNGGRRGPGGPGGRGFNFGGRRGFFDDRRQNWPAPQAPAAGQYGQPQPQPQPQYGAPNQQQAWGHGFGHGQQPAGNGQPAPGAAPPPPVNYGAAPQPPVNYSAAPPPPPVYPTSPPPAPGYPQSEPGSGPAPAAGPDPNKPVS